MEWDAALYKNRHAFVHEYGRKLLDFVDGRRHCIVLDLGCGTGDLTHVLAERCERVVGVDASEAMIRAAKRRYPGLELYVLDALDMDFSAQFDLVFSNAVFHWITDQATLLEKIRKALRPNGSLVCELGAKGNIGNIERSYAQATKATDREYVSRFFFPSAKEYAETLRVAGFDVENIIEYDRPTPLEGGINGLRDWLKQFFAGDLCSREPAEQERLLKQVEGMLEDVLWDGEKWTADYRRLQVVAHRRWGDYGLIHTGRPV